MVKKHIHTGKRYTGGAVILAGWQEVGIRHLSNDTIALSGWWARRRCIVGLARPVVCRLGGLKFDTVLLLAVWLLRSVVALVLTAAVVAVVGGRSGVLGWWLLPVLLAIVIVVGLCSVVLVLLIRSRGPSGAVEWLTTGLAAATSCYATVKEQLAACRDRTG